MNGCLNQDDQDLRIDRMNDFWDVLGLSESGAKKSDRGAMVQIT